MRARSIWITAVVLTLGLSVDHPLRAFTPDDDNAGWIRTDVIFDLDTFVINSCYNDDRVHILGEGLISVKTRILSDGTMEIKEKDHFSGDGLDASGSRYTFKEDAHINQSIGPNPDGTPFSYMERRKQKLKGVGGTPDQRITYDIRLIIEGDGTVTVDIFNVQIECN